LKNLAKVLNIIVFLFSASVIISFFYQGSLVPSLLTAMFCAFVLATMCNFYCFFKIKVLRALNIFSALTIASVAAIGRLGQDLPAIFLLFWVLYIFLYHFALIVKRVWEYPVEAGY
jgi:hypothetical protein